jgi:hypothetical protein
VRRPVDRLRESSHVDDVDANTDDHAVSLAHQR